MMPMASESPLNLPGYYFQDQYLLPLDQPGSWNSSVGEGICYRPPSRAWKVMLGYGYGLNAIRGQDRGASELGFLAQYDLEARHRSRQEAEKPTLDPLKLRGFNRLFRR